FNKHAPGWRTRWPDRLPLPCAPVPPVRRPSGASARSRCNRVRWPRPVWRWKRDAHSLSSSGNRRWPAKSSRSWAVSRLLMALRRRHGTPYRLVIGLLALGEAARCQGDDVRAAAYLSEGLTLSRQIDNRISIAWAQYNFAQLARDRGAPVEAHLLFVESLEIA